MDNSTFDAGSRSESYIYHSDDDNDDNELYLNDFRSVSDDYTSSSHGESVDFERLMSLAINADGDERPLNIQQFTHKQQQNHITVNSNSAINPFPNVYANQTPIQNKQQTKDNIFHKFSNSIDLEMGDSTRSLVKEVNSTNPALHSYMNENNITPTPSSNLLKSAMHNNLNKFPNSSLLNAHPQFPFQSTPINMNKNSNNVSVPSNLKKEVTSDLKDQSDSSQDIIDDLCGDKTIENIDDDVRTENAVKSDIESECAFEYNDENKNYNQRIENQNIGTTERINKPLISSESLEEIIKHIHPLLSSEVKSFTDAIHELIKNQKSIQYHVELSNDSKGLSGINTIHKESEMLIMTPQKAHSRNSDTSTHDNQNETSETTLSPQKDEKNGFHEKDFSNSPTSSNSKHADMFKDIKVEHFSTEVNQADELAQLKKFLSTSEDGKSILTKFYNVPLKSIESNQNLLKQKSNRTLQFTYGSLNEDKSTNIDGVEDDSESESTDYDASYIPKSFSSKNVSMDGSSELLYVRQELSKKECLIKELENELKISQNQVKSSNNTLNERLFAIQAAKTEIEKLKVSICNLSEEVMSKNEEISNMSSRLKTNEMDLKNFTKKLAESELSVEKYQQESVFLKDQVAEGITENQNNEISINGLKVQLSLMAQDLESSKAENDSILQQNKLQNDDLINKSADISKLKVEINKCSIRIKELEDKLAAQTVFIHDLENEIAKKGAAQNDNTSKEKVIEELKKYISQCELNLSSLLGANEPKLDSESLPTLTPNQNSSALYEKLGMHDVDNLSLIRSHNIIKNILLQFAIKFSELPAQTIKLSRMIKLNSCLVKFTDDMHDAIYSDMEYKPSMIVTNFENKMVLVEQRHLLKNCLGDMIRNVSSLKRENFF